MKAGIGAKLADGKTTHFFSVALDDVLVNDINMSQRKTVIFELELFAILCAVIGWKQFVTYCAIVVYTDNDAVRDRLISCHTSSGNAGPILDLYLKVEFELKLPSMHGCLEYLQIRILLMPHLVVIVSHCYLLVLRKLKPGVERRAGVPDTWGRRRPATQFPTLTKRLREWST